MTILEETGRTDELLNTLAELNAVANFQLVTSYDDEAVYVKVWLAEDDTGGIRKVRKEHGLRIGMAAINDGQLVVTLGPFHEEEA